MADTSEGAAASNGSAAATPAAAATAPAASDAAAAGGGGGAGGGAGATASASASSSSLSLAVGTDAPPRDTGAAVDLIAEKLENLTQRLHGGPPSPIKATASSSSSSIKGRERGGSVDERHRAGRMTEAQEDEQLLSSAMEEQQVVRLTVQPPNIKFGTMRDYQLEGLNWLIKLHDTGLNGILADEMGLGKTLQTISLFAYLRHFRGNHGPHLVVVPKSTLGNWMKEFKRWCPELVVLRLHSGVKTERQRLVREELMSRKYEVIVTSYEVISIERAALRKFKWDYIAIDEAHRIKNEQSALSKELRILHSNHRLLITGTPLQNNLHELWALLNFLLPDMFKDSTVFDNMFQEGEADQQAVKKLHAMLRPFLLRRLKSDVEHSLLPKSEMKVYVGMSRLQQQWYTKVLSKDAAALNSLGGADKVRLLNILMQLRKVCNHPYLFDGAEPGPPYSDGPHLWESCGKMQLLDRLLGRLKEQGSRVLIFSQMTRMLDILEDYMRYKGFGYCRIDGNTKGNERDDAMEIFNAPGSEKFCFLLSTRAGGLGINLATADIVILYDSDWNPQMDLQAMDRAHRIGQKKQVRVFRFITEGAVEEKIVERADRKLYLDAVVIQQGRLLEKNKKLSKGELMTMVKFGANQIFRQQKSTVSKEDVDAIIERSMAKAKQAQQKVKKDMEHNLQTFKMDGGMAESSIYMFHGQDFSNLEMAQTGADLMISLPQRERKRNYDVNEYYREALRVTEKREVRDPRVAKLPQMHDYQFFERDRIAELVEKDNSFAIKRRHLSAALKDARAKEARERKREIRHRVTRFLSAGMTDADAHAAAESELDKEALEDPPPSAAIEAELKTNQLTEDEAAEKERLMAEGFSNWKWRDFRTFVSVCEKHGRRNTAAVFAEVAESTEKDEAEVARYFDVFWRRGKELADWTKIEERILKGEQRLQRRESIAKLLATAVKKHANPFQTLKVIYGSSKAQGKHFSMDEDRFLICMMHQLGYGEWEQMREEVRNAWQFRFDWYMKSRTTTELQRRCDALIRMMEKDAKGGSGGGAGAGVGRKKRGPKPKARPDKRGRSDAASTASSKKKSRR